jgi:mono/diheme cytochrome c family protein
MASLLHLSPLDLQVANYLRLVGLLVSGLGLLYILSGRLNAQGFVFASLVDRPLVPGIMAILWYLEILPGPVALAFSITDFSGFLWTLWAWRKDEREGPYINSPSLFAGIVARIFGFASGVVRNSRVFHPDGRVFLGNVRSLQPSDPGLARAAEQLTGAVLLRIGMGLMKTGAPRWLAKWVPDAPSISARFFHVSNLSEIRLQRLAGEDLDLLCTAGGDRLWKLVLNLATGGRSCGLQPLDYFGNLYFAQTPYRIDNGRLDVWIRFVPATDLNHVTPRDHVSREEALTTASVNHAVLRVEAQQAGNKHAPFVPIAEIRFEREIQVDQEALHFDPVTGRGFVPHGFLTSLRKSVYPVSFQSRPPTKEERTRREGESISRRLRRFFSLRPVYPIEGGGSTMDNPTAMHTLARPKRHPWRAAALVVVAALVAIGVYLVVRLTSDQPIDYADDLRHFKHGSTGGERLTGIPYWFWVALPELFPEYLPDKTPGRGYSSFGMIYENGDDPRYALPVGVSMRKVRGIDLVYLNCAVCHTGTVRDAPGAPARVIAAMPANTFDLGAWGKFLTTIPLSEKFTPQRINDQIRAMQDDSHRLVEKPDLINKLIFRYLAVYLARERLLMLRDRLSFIDTSTWGPGRVDTFNAPKALLNFPMKNADPKELMGNVDFPSVWYQGPRKGMQLHWDGNNTSVDERNLSAAFGTGAYPPTLDAPRALRTAKWLETAKPPAYPYAINQTLAAQGALIYGQYCAGCHGTREAPFRQNPPQANECVGTVTPIDKIGTDRWRLDSYTWLLAVNQSTLYAGYEKDWGFNPPYPQRFTHFRKTNGYANTPLDGIWLRAPYLHNGSVPNLRELLMPAAARTKFFYRGNDVYDTQNVGFISNAPTEGGRRFFAFNTADRGNGNGGHEGAVYGTDLPPGEKDALLEYLKTF